METFDIIYILGNFFMAFVLYKYMHIFYDTCRFSPAIEKAAYLGHALVITLIYLALPLPACFLASNILTIFGLTLLYNGNAQKSILVTVTAYVSMVLIESLFAFAVYYIGADPFSPIQFDSSFLSVLIRISNYAFVRLMAGFQNMKRNTTMPLSYWLSLILIPFFSLVQIFIFLHYTQVLPVHTVIAISCGLAINIIAFYIYDKIAELMEEKMAFTLDREQSRFYETQVKMMKTSLEEMRILRHDLKNSLTPVYSLLLENKTEAALSCLSHLASIYDTGKEFSHSGNPTIDALINYKLQHIDCEKTELAIHTILPSQLNIPDYDIAVILGNLLDNAIEAIALADTPMLTLNLKYTKGCLVMCISNSFDGTLLSVEKELISRKADKVNHGLGLKSVRKTLEKYDGVLEVKQTANVFTAKALLYV